MDRYTEQILKIIEQLKKNAISSDAFEKISTSIDELSKTFFFDFQIVCNGFIFPCHKHVLSFRSKVLKKKLEKGISELNWSNYKKKEILSILKWLYTDEVNIENQNHGLALLQASFVFQFRSLFQASERMLVKSVNETSYHEFYDIAVAVGAKTLVKKCLQIQRANAQSVPPSGKELNSCSYCSHIVKKLHRETAGENISIQNKQLLIAIGIRKYLNTTDQVVVNRFENWPIHAYILDTRCNKSWKKDSPGPYKSTYSKDVTRGLLRWIYTDIVETVNPCGAMNLIRASYNLQLLAMFEVCQDDILNAKFDISLCSELIDLGIYINSKTVLEHGTKVLSEYWEGLDNYRNLPKIILNSKNHVGGPWYNHVQRAIREDEISKTPIMRLNDDCLLEIFDYISVTDLCNIKSTCVRFSGLADQSFRSFGTEYMSIDNSSVFEDIWNLQSFGQFIGSLYIKENYIQSIDDICAIVANVCTTNLKTITFSSCGHLITKKSIRLLSKILRNIEAIVINRFCCSEKILWILSKCQNLKALDISSTDLVLKSLWNQKNCKIKRIELRYSINENVLKKFRKFLSDLEYLDFNCYEISKTSDLKCFTEFDHLKELKIDFHFRSLLQIIQNLAKKNLLEYFSMTDLRSLNKGVVNALVKFTKLKELTVNNLCKNINLDVLEILSKKPINVEKLIFLRCNMVSLTRIISFIKDNLKLKELMIMRCGRISAIDQSNYLKLQAHINLKIFLDDSVYDSIKSLPDIITDKFLPITDGWDRWHV